MSLKVNYDQLATKEEAYEAVKGAVTPEMLSKFQVKADLDYQTDKIIASGKGFSLEMSFEETFCEVNIKLSLLLKPLKGKVLEGVEKQLKRII